MRQSSGIGFPEVCLLIAVAVLPAWMSAYSSFGYQPDKAWTLGMLVCAGAGALIARLGAQERISAWWQDVRPSVVKGWIGPRNASCTKQEACSARPERAWHLAWEERIALPVVLGIVALASLSTVLSIQPAWAWWGSPHRAQGLFNLLMLAGAFWLARRLLRHPAGAWLLVRVILLSNLPILLIALWQRAGWPLPTPWAGDFFGQRPFSTLGNPVFLGSFLVLSIPFTFSEMAGGLTGRPLARLGLAVNMSGLGILLAMQLLVLYWTASRGAWLGLVGGLAFAGLAYAAYRRKWRVAIALGVFLLGLLVGILFVAQGTRLDMRIGESSLGWLLDPTGSGRQRLLIWEEITRYWSSGQLSPLRLCVGFGPDTQGLILPVHITQRAPARSDPFASPTFFDRSHNLILDSLLAGGLLGLVGQIALGIVAIWAGLRRMGWVFSLRLLLAGAGIGMITLAGLGWLIGGGTSLLPLALGLGPCAGIVMFMATSGIVRWRTAHRLSASECPCTSSQMAAADNVASPLLIVPALAGVFGHWIDLQFGFETQTAGLLMWVCVALLLSSPPKSWHSSGDMAPLLAVACGAILVACLVGAGDASGMALLGPLGAIWLISGFFIATWAGPRAWLFYPLISLGPLLLMGLAKQWIASTPGWNAVWITGSAWACLLACAGAAGWWLAKAVPCATGEGHYPVEWVMVGALIALGGIFLTARPAVSDILTSQAISVAREGKWETSFTLLQDAVRWGVHDSLAYDALAQMWLGRARAEGNPEAAKEAFASSAKAMQLAWQASPYQAEYGRRLALIYWEWAETTTDSQERRVHLAEALGTLERVTAAMPADQRTQDDVNTLREALSSGDAP